jgi:hypothetical protein
METDKQIFKNFLRSKGFTVYEVVSQKMYTPAYYKSIEGDHCLISNISVCIFGGSDVPTGGLGCVTFYYGGVKKQKYKKIACVSEILKETTICNNSDDAITKFKKWLEDTKIELKTWKRII